MTEESIALWIQVASIVAAVFASVVALRIASRDRREARMIAADDRRASLEQAMLLFDLEALVRLLENRNRGGSTDREETSRMGAEALTLIGLIGEERLPRQFARQVEVDDQGLQSLIDDPEMPGWKKDAIETQLAVNGLTRRVRELLERQ